jgi:exopolyphosphatase/guanosine-5'-triphosphate,3'-diphosphate pyrophosphatase
MHGTQQHEIKNQQFTLGLNMTAAAIDLGTNTFHLIIGRSTIDGIEVLYKTAVAVKLGEGRINENIIIPEAFERGLVALEEFAATIADYQPDVVLATATSAVRSASNGADFVQAAWERSQLKIETISGDEEASYIFKGVQGTGLIAGTCLVMDIGGGSTEFILCKANEILWKRSYDIGAARLMQAFFKSDPLNPEERRSIISHLDQTLPDLLEVCRRHQPETLIGSAGAFESFSGMLQIERDAVTENGLEALSVTSGAIDVSGYRKLADRLIHASHQERAGMPGLIPLRVDMIVIASLLVNYVLENTPIKNISVSTNDLKMGVLYTLLGQS